MTDKRPTAKAFRGLEFGYAQKLERFLTRMVQSLLRIGYYDPSHPESGKIKTGLFDQFNEYLADQYDLTFVARESEKQSQVLLTGIMTDPVKLEDAIIGSRAKVYTVKLAEFMSRKNLVSLTLKKELGEEEFRNFVDVLSETTIEDIKDLKGAMDRFTKALRDRGITHISYLFDRDIVGLDRGLNWQVWLCMSRLKKDLRLIPILQKLSAEEFKIVRRQVFTEVIRPIAKPEFLSELLMNCDLIETEEMSTAEVMEEVEANVPGELIADTCGELLKWVATDTQDDLAPVLPVEEAQAKSIIRSLFPKMGEAEAMEASSLWEKLYREGVVRLEELPEHLRDKLYTERRIEKFMNDPTGAVGRFHATTTWESYFKYIQLFWRIVPEILRKENYGEVRLILAALNEHCAEGGIRARWAEVAREAIGGSAATIGLEKVYASGDKEKRTEMTELIVELGAWGQAVLMEVIRSTQDQWTLKNACETMTSFGFDAVSSLVLELNQGRIPEPSYRAVLATIGDACLERGEATEAVPPEFLKVLKRFLRHPDAAVREEAVTTLGKIGNLAVEDDVIHTLDDADAKVRRKAIWCLGMIHSEKAIPTLLELLQSDKSDEEMEHFKKEACVALTLIGNHSTDAGSRIEDVLCGMLIERRGGEIVRLLRRSGKSEGLKAVVCRALGMIGTDRSVPALEAAAESRSESLRDEAGKALTSIRERGVVQT